MAKYIYEFKKEIVNAYMNGEEWYKFLENKYGLFYNRIINIKVVLF